LPEKTQFGEIIADPKADLFYAAALDRIRRFMLAIGVLATAVALVAFNWRAAAGVFLGCAVAWANFVWLKQAIGALADKVTLSGESKSSAGTVFKFLLRYALVGLGAYVIFLSSRESLYGFLGGLFLAVAAILCEAAYELFVGLRRGF
jgi:hypothetical protein